MSALLMGRAFYTDLPAHLRFLLVALCDTANDEGRGIFISQAHLALKTGAGERTVRRNLNELRELGYLERIGKSAARTDVYRIDLAHLPSDEAIAESKRSIRRPANLAGASDQQEEADRPPAAGLDRPPTAAKPLGNREKPLERERNPAFDALAEAGGKNPKALTRSELRTVGVKLAEIVEVEKRRLDGDFAVEDLANTIRLAGVRYRRLHPEWELTPAAIAGHWSELVASPPTPVQPDASDQPSSMRSRDPAGGEDDGITVEESERIGAEILRQANERRMAASRGQEPESDPGLAGGEEAAPPATGGSEEVRA